MRILFILSLFSTAICAQVTEDMSMMSLGKQNAFIIDHEGADAKTLSSFWEDAFKEYGKVKRNRKAKEWYCESCQISLVSTTPVAVYFKIVEGKGQSTSYTYIDDGQQFISSENAPEKAEQFKDLLYRMSLDVRREVIRQELENEENLLKNLNKDLSKLEKRNKDLHEDIEKLKQKIVETENDIHLNLEEQDNKKVEIKKQEKVIERVAQKLNNVGRKDN